MASNVKQFICKFSNGLRAVMGADSKEDALAAVKEMETISGAKLIDVEEVTPDSILDDNGYLPNVQPQLNDGNVPDDDVDVRF